MSKLKIEIKSWLSGAILFEYESENNTIAKTLQKAVEARANLSGADLRSADLRSANLRSANLSDANLSDANLSGADLSGADLSGAVGSDYAIAITRILPEGDLIGYKKAYNELHEKIIVKLRIPADAKRSSAFGRKCRAEFADVLEIFGAAKAFSENDPKFSYEVGQRVTPTKPFDENWMEECSTGIHFFITKLEAENYF
jgi:hypothetical protein